jgi:hypothetical protein
MIRRSVFSALLMTATAVVGVASSGVAPATAAQKKKAYFIDILYLNKGKTPADAKAYFDKTVPVVAKHGLKRVTPGFVVTQKMAGDIEPNLVNVWSVGDPGHTFDNIFKDPNYLRHVELRNATFDMSRSHMFMLKAAE